jgi:hypothetical protein
LRQVEKRELYEEVKHDLTTADSDSGK